MYHFVDSSAGSAILLPHSRPEYLFASEVLLEEVEDRVEPVEVGGRGRGTEGDVTLNG